MHLKDYHKCHFLWWKSLRQLIKIHIFFSTFRAGMHFRTCPSPLWSPTRCTISELDPNLAPACGASGVQTSPAGLKRRVSGSVVTCTSSNSSERQPDCVCVSACTEWEHHWLYLKTNRDLNGVFRLSLWFFIYAGCHWIKVSFHLCFLTLLSAHHWGHVGYFETTETGLTVLWVESKISH